MTEQVLKTNDDDVYVQRFIDINKAMQDWKDVNSDVNGIDVGLNLHNQVVITIDFQHAVLPKIVIDQ